MICTGDPANNSPERYEYGAAWSCTRAHLQEIRTALQRTIVPQATITTGPVGLSHRSHFLIYSYQYRMDRFDVIARGGDFLLQLSNCSAHEAEHRRSQQGHFQQPLVTTLIGTHWLHGAITQCDRYSD